VDYVTQNIDWVKLVFDIKLNQSLFVYAGTNIYMSFVLFKFSDKTGCQFWYGLEQKFVKLWQLHVTFGLEGCHFSCNDSWN
jgi:hypothetical protein